MGNNINLVVYPAKNLEKTKIVFSKFLGVDPYVQGSYYVGYKLDNLEVGLDPNGQAIICYVDVTDIKSSLQNLIDAGAAIQQDQRRRWRPVNCTNQRRQRQCVRS
jgi:hypothetical protein